MNKLGQLFNEYASEFSRLTEECPFDIDQSVGDIRFRLFGSNERKNLAYKMDHPESSSKIYFSTVSSKQIVVWGDIRMVKSGPHKGEIVINPLSLGHEDIHCLRIIMANWGLHNEDEGELLSPDKYVEI